MILRPVYPLVALASVSAMASCASKNDAAQKPNIILIMTDQQRFDCIGAVNPLISTPNIDAIAADGMLFKNGYVASPSSTPARSVLLTGMTPWHAGMTGYHAKVAEKYPNEMPALLGAAGYRTVGIGKMHWFPQRTSHGFDTLILDESSRVESPGFRDDYRAWFAENAPGLNADTTGIGWNAHAGRVYALPEELHPTRWTGNVAVETIEANSDTGKPLFMKVSFARPHSPYDPPQRYFDMYKDVAIPEPWVGDWCGDFADRPMIEDAPFGDFGVEHAVDSRRHYYAAVTFIDDQVGRIVKALKDNGMYDNSIIIFTSDHGDMLGDHNHWRKTYPYEGSAHIPFIMKVPGNLASGEMREQCVDLRDILPTFLDVAGAEIPAMDGRSMLPLAEDNGAPWREYIETEHSRCYAPKSGWVALTDGKTKYVWFYNQGAEQFFDLMTDPHELREASADVANAETIAMWRGRMIETLAERGDDWVKDGKLVQNDIESPLNANYPKSN